MTIPDYSKKNILTYVAQLFVGPATPYANNNRTEESENRVKFIDDIIIFTV